MKFREKLNEYMERLSCSAKDLCTLSGISAASFSRYKNGERVPEMAPFRLISCAALLWRSPGREKCRILRPTPLKKPLLPPP